MRRQIPYEGIVSSVTRKNMAQKEGKVETFSPKHIKPRNTANTPKPESYLKTTQQTVYNWRRTEDLTVKGKGAKLTEQDPSPRCAPAHRWEKEKLSGKQVGAQDH